MISMALDSLSGSVEGDGDCQSSLRRSGVVHSKTSQSSVQSKLPPSRHKGARLYSCRNCTTSASRESYTLILAALVTASWERWGFGGSVNNRVVLVVKNFASVKFISTAQNSIWRSQKHHQTEGRRPISEPTNKISLLLHLWKKALDLSPTQTNLNIVKTLLLSQLCLISLPRLSGQLQLETSVTGHGNVSFPWGLLLLWSNLSLLVKALAAVPKGLAALESSLWHTLAADTISLTV